MRKCENICENLFGENACKGEKLKMPEHVKCANVQIRNFVITPHARRDENPARDSGVGTRVTAHAGCGSCVKLRCISRQLSRLKRTRPGHAPRCPLSPHSISVRMVQARRAAFSLSHRTYFTDRYAYHSLATAPRARTSLTRSCCHPRIHV